MGMWLTELRRNLPADIVLHVVGTKADIVAREPSKREVPFERCIAYVAENLTPGFSSTPPPTAASNPTTLSGFFQQQPQSVAEPRSPSSKRSSGFWGQELAWHACHEISAESGEGVDEVFRVVTRKLVEQNRKMQQALLAATATPGLDAYTPGMPGSGLSEGGGRGYFDDPRASFRVGRDRRSWLFSPGFATPVPVDQPEGEQGRDGVVNKRGGCCS